MLIFTILPIKTLTKNLIFINAKTEAVKRLHAVFLKLRNSADVQLNCMEQLFILTSLTSRDSMLLLECKLQYILMFCDGVFLNKYTKNVNRYV